KRPKFHASVKISNGPRGLIAPASRGSGSATGKPQSLPTKPPRLPNRPAQSSPTARQSTASSCTTGGWDDKRSPEAPSGCDQGKLQCGERRPFTDRRNGRDARPCDRAGPPQQREYLACDPGRSPRQRSPANHQPQT